MNSDCTAIAQQYPPLLQQQEPYNNGTILANTTYGAATTTSVGEIATRSSLSSIIEDVESIQVKRQHVQQLNDTASTLSLSSTTSPLLPIIHIVAILSSSFTYGCIGTTLFMITLPMECERIDSKQKSIVLGIFLMLAGITQLISPIVGQISDTYIPPYHQNDYSYQQQQQQQQQQRRRRRTRRSTDRNAVSSSSSSLLHQSPPPIQQPPQQTSTHYEAEFGSRLPYYIVGGVCTFIGLIGQILTSYNALWIHYSIAYIFTMIGLNMQYSIMLVLIPDQISYQQTGTANGILAFLLVTGSIFGFTLFHVLTSSNVLYPYDTKENIIQCMYSLYVSIVILTSIVTCLYAYERDAELATVRLQQQQLLPEQLQSQFLIGKSSHVNSNNDNFVDSTSTSDDETNVLTPLLILRSMIVPIQQLNCHSIIQCYMIDVKTDYNFCIVTLSRLFYYCGMSVQTFFLFYIHDIIHIYTHPETTVATLAMIGQCSGALICYPIGILSDQYLCGRRKPFIYLACIILASATFTLIYTRTYNQVVITCIILGAANGMYLTAETSLAVDTLESSTTLLISSINSKGDDVQQPPQQQQQNERGKAKLLGIWGVAAFIGSALGPMIGGPLLAIVGSSNYTTTATLSSNDSSTTLQQHEQHRHNNNYQHFHSHSNNEIPSYTSEYTIYGYMVVLSLSSLYFICSAITLIFIKGRYN